MASKSRRDKDADPHHAAAETAETDPLTGRMIARARRLMLISGLTTLVAIAAVIGVIGYRVFRASGSVPPTIEGTVVLPKGAVVIASAVAEGRIVVMFDIDGATEIRTFDVKTLKETGRIKFATRP